ncbi:MAG: carbon-nitrogen hydrolase family protein [Legionellaceae bacterium]|nr:carbon-nitrogen hydrolase family protein [Legionellaceae bacterium]
MTPSMVKEPSLLIRNATLNDVPAISKMIEKTYAGIPDWPAWPLKALKSHIKIFPEGQFVALFDGKIVAYSASILISGDIALKPHTWDEISAHGFGTTHDPQGDYLYGIETCVDPDYWDYHIGQRIYDLRKEFCVRWHLKGIIAGGRLPRLAAEIKQGKSPEQYINMVQQEKIMDHTLAFQLRNGFEVIGVLKNYLPEDAESSGFATHLIWRNPEIADQDETPKSKGQIYAHRPNHHYLDVDHARVATVQYEQRKINSFEEFSAQVEYFIRVVAEYHTDFVLFPESFTMQLLSIENKALSPDKAILKLSTYTERFKEMMVDFALKYNINIIGGSTATQVDDHIQNISYIFLRDGSVHAQAKIHPTPDERRIWRMQGASRVDKIMTDCGPIGVLICYDSEFPELTRHLVDQGMLILFVPFCTDQRMGYLRVRYCAQARAIENQCYVVMAGNVGNLPGVHNMNVQYSQSCILTPCDFPFARDGIAADTTPNVETIAFADLNIKTLIAGRNTGSVINLKDRRDDLYSIQWHEPGSK